MSRRHILLVTAALFAALALHVAMRSKHPLAALGGWATDHAAHTGATVLFAYQGFHIYGTPINQLCPALPDQHAWARRYRAYPGQMCSPEGRDPARPLLINWAEYPRFYPPGANLYAVPEAILFEAGLSFHAVNQITIIKYAAAALLAVLMYLLLAGHLIRTEPVMLLSVLVIASELLRWGLTGFYDGLSVGLIFLVVHLVRGGRHPEALAAFGTALLLHYRAIWFLPLAVVAAARLVQDLRVRGARMAMGGRAGVWVLLGIVSSAASLVCLLLSRPALAAMKTNNPLLMTGQNMGALQVGIVTLIGAVLLVRERAWLGLSVLGTQGLVLMLTPEVRPWHSVFALGLIGVGYLSERARVRVVFFAIYLTESVAIFRNLALPGAWLETLLAGHF